MYVTSKVVISPLSLWPISISALPQAAQLYRRHEILPFVDLSHRLNFQTSHCRWQNRRIYIYLFILIHSKGIVFQTFPIATDFLVIGRMQMSQLTQKYCLNELFVQSAIASIRIVHVYCIMSTRWRQYSGQSVSRLP